MKEVSFMPLINRIEEALKSTDNPEYIEYLTKIIKVFEGVEIATIKLESTLQKIECKNEKRSN